MRVVKIDENDLTVVGDIVAELSGRYETVESAGFQREADTYAAELPRELRRAIAEYRDSETDAMLLLSGLPVDSDAIGLTPGERGGAGVPSPSLPADIFFYLAACLLGEPIGWATQQSGRVMHDVYPVRAHAHDQIGWGSDETLAWHTEDAFHPLRPDYLGLMCLRNPDAVQTTVAEVTNLTIDDAARDYLMQERFRIVPDDSHRVRNSGASGGSGAYSGGGSEQDARAAELSQRSYEMVERLAAAPEPVAVLFGSPHSPYIRMDPFYMSGVQAGPEEEEALRALAAALDQALTGVALGPGDICFIDNYRAVHGRRRFRANFDGKDRWLRRLNVTRDLRKSRAHRVSAESRVIH